MQTWDVRGIAVSALRPSETGGCWVAGSATAWDYGAGTRQTLWHADPGGALRRVAGLWVAADYIYECPDRRVVTAGRRSGESFSADPAGTPEAVAGARAFILADRWLCRFDTYGAHRCVFARRGTTRTVPVLDGLRTHPDAPQGFACRAGVALVGLWGRLPTDSSGLQPYRLVVARFDSTLGRAAAPAVFVQLDVPSLIVDNTLYRWLPTADGLLLRARPGDTARLFGWDGQGKPLGHMLRHLPVGLAACDVRGDLAVAGGATDFVWRRRGDKHPTRFGVKSRSKDQEKVGRVAISGDGLTAWFERGGTLYAIDME